MQDEILDRDCRLWLGGIAFTRCWLSVACGLESPIVFAFWWTVAGSLSGGEKMCTLHLRHDDVLTMAIQVLDGQS